MPQVSAMANSVFPERERGYSIFIIALNPALGLNAES